MTAISAFILIVISSAQATPQSNPAQLNPVIEAEDLRDAKAPALVEAARSIDPKVRVSAATAFGRILKPEGIDPLLMLLNDPNLEVKSAALFNLGQFGWDGKFAGGRENEIVAHISPLIQNENPMVRVNAIQAIGKLALLQTPSLVGPSLSKTEPATVRAEAALALFRYHDVYSTKNSGAAIADISPAILQALTELAEDSEAIVRRAIAYYFFYVKDPRGFDAIMKLSLDADLWTRYYATVAFGTAEDVRANDRLLMLCQDPSPIVRVAAVNSLSHLGSIGLLPVPLLASLEKDSDFHVRAALASATGVSSHDVQLLLKDSDLAVRAAALNSWSLVGGVGSISELKTALSDPDWTIRAASEQALSNLGALAEDLVLQGAKDSDVRVRDPSIDNLAALTDAASFDVIAHALTSDQYSERFGAVDAMAARKDAHTDDRVPTELWNAYLRSIDRTSILWDGVREEAIAQLAGLKDPSIVDELKQALNDSDPNVVGLAIQGLQSRGATNLPVAPAEKLTFSPYRTLKLPANPKVTITTTRGRIVILLYPHEAPIHVASFVGFAEAHGYDGLPWHRLVSDYIVQGGDPDKTGFGNAGYYLRNEINARHFERGSLSMARADDFNGDGVQIFIDLVPTPKLDGLYTVFGQVIEGMDVVDQLEVGDLILSARLIR